MYTGITGGSFDLHVLLVPASTVSIAESMKCEMTSSELDRTCKKVVCQGSGYPG